MGRLAIVTVIVAALGLAACGGPPESRVALSDPEAAADPAAFVGNWFQPADDGAFYLRLAAREDSRVLDAIGISVGWEEGNAVRWLRASVHLTEIDGRVYANIRRHPSEGDDYTAPGQPPGTIIARLDLSSAGALLIGWMSSNAIEGLIEEGRAQGARSRASTAGRRCPICSWT